MATNYNRITRYGNLVIYSEGGNEPWLECTNAEKEQWEKDHPQPEPEPEAEPEPEVEQ